MYLKDIAQIIAANYKVGQTESEIFVAAIIDTILEGLEKDRLVKLKGFGTFKLTSVRERQSVNVNTGERMTISEHDKITFTPDSVMRDLINKPFAQFETVILADGVKFEDVETIDENSGKEDDDTLGETVTAIPASQTENEVALAIKETDIANEKTIEEQQEESDKTLVAESTDSEDANNELSEEQHQTVYEYTKESIKTEEQLSEENTVAEQSATTENVDEPSMSSFGENIEERQEIVNEIEEQPVAGDGSIAETTELDDDNEEIVYEDDNRWGKWWKYLLLVLMLVLSFVLGNVVSSRKWFVLESVNVSKVADDVCVFCTSLFSSSDKEKAIPETKRANDSQYTVPSQKKADEQKKKEGKPVTQSNTAPKEVKDDFENVNKSDARVRTGAYNIIGIEKEVVVTSGQTVRSISEHYLGEGMECYVEALNGGIKEVTPGQKIKIPKLQLKKRKTE